VTDKRFRLPQRVVDADGVRGREKAERKRGYEVPKLPSMTPQILAQIVPEPGTFVVLGVEMGGLAEVARIRRTRV
jgi:hypothetical protein